MDEEKKMETHGPGDGTGLDWAKIPGGCVDPTAAAGGKLVMGSPEWLEEVFSYHSPDGKQVEAYGRIRLAARILAENILASAPPCADRTAALRKVREAVMTANAAIALRGLV